MNPAGLQALFEPKSIAVVGASRRPKAVGYAVFRNLLSASFKGKVYPVNPKTDRMESLPCYPSILDISDPVDLAVLIVPSRSSRPARLREKEHSRGDCDFRGFQGNGGRRNAA